MVFREGRTKAVGNVIEPIVGTVGKPNNPKPNKLHMRGSGSGGQQNRNPNALHGEQSSPSAVENNVASAANVNAVKEETEGVIDMGGDKRDLYHHRSRTKRQN